MLLDQMSLIILKIKYFKNTDEYLDYELIEEYENDFRIYSCSEEDNDDNELNFKEDFYY